MNENLIEAFDACVTALENGASLEECLGKYPEFSSELRPMLTTTLQTMEVMHSIPVPFHSQQKSRARFLEQAARLSNKPEAFLKPTRKRGLTQSLFQMAFSRTFATAALLVVILLAAGAGAARASTRSLPGTPLYGLKRTIEQTQILLSPDTTSRARLEEEFNERRLQETRQVVEQGWKVAVEFSGELDAMNGQNWEVAGVAVSILPDAEIEGRPQIGLYVRVKGESQPGGSVLARQIKVEGERFEGLVETIQKDVWQVGGRLVLIDDDTRIDDHPAVGDWVEVNVMNLPGGSRVAERIRLLSRGTADDEVGQPSNTPSTPTGDHKDGADGEDQKETEPAPTASPEEKSPSNTLDSSGSGKTPEPSKTAEPEHTPNPTQTPHSDGSNGSNSSTSTPPTNQEVRIEGTLELITANAWTVAGQTIRIDGNTLIEDNPQPGDIVEVRAIFQSDGTLLALRIKQ